MNFLAPAAFALAALLPVIVAMYLLQSAPPTADHLQRLPLAAHGARHVEANALATSPQPAPDLAVDCHRAARAGPHTRPFTWTEGIGGQTAVLVVDVRQHGAADGSPTRLDDAKTQLRMLIDSLPANSTATLITAGEDVRIAVSSSRDRRQLHDAVNALRVGAGGSRLDAALELASAVAARQPDAEIVVYSDFAGIDDAGFLLDRIDDAAVRFVTLGARTWNQSVTALALQRAPDAASLIAFVQVTNFSEDPVQRRLVLSPAQGDALAAYDLDLPAQGERVVVVEDLPPTLPAVVASLSGEDLLPVDDRAWAVAPTAAAVDVTLVTPGNRFLETALALQPGLSLTTVRPADYRPVEADLTIIDGSLPVTMPLPAGNLLIVGPVRSSELFSVTGELDLPDPLAVDRSDPLLANVNLGEISILRSASIVTPAWARPLVVDAADSTSPLLFAGELGDRRVAVLTFDLRRSDLPLQVAFPILLSNLTGWLAASSAQTPTALDPGQPLAFNATADRRRRQHRAPGRRVRHARVARTGLTSNSPTPTPSAPLPDHLGRRHPGLVAVNSAAAQNQHRASSPPPPQKSVKLCLLQAARREWWRPLAFVALTVLVAEWIAYRRSGEEDFECNA
ncbi:MAG: VWA domain-containing protein [Caldilineaceae bacterium]